MKKFFAMAAFAALTMAGMTSCSNDDAIETGAMPNSSIQKDGAIGFNITQDGAIGTRGTATTSLNYLSQISDFQVIGFYSDGTGRYVGSADNARHGTTAPLHRSSTGPLARTSTSRLSRPQRMLPSRWPTHLMPTLRA